MIRIDPFGVPVQTSGGSDRHLVLATIDAMTNPEPLPFHRMARLSVVTARWWRPLLAVLCSLILWLALALLVIAADHLTAILGLLPGVSEEMDDSANPSDYLVLLGAIAMGVPAVLLGARWGWRRRGTLHSVDGRFRWSLLRAAVIVVPVMAVVNGALLVPGLDGGRLRIDANLLVIVVLVLAVTPLQCAAEEYLFRVLPQQMLGTWLRSPWWGIVLPVPLFVLGHGYDWAGQLDIAIFALAMGVLVWKTGGVELAILMHAANNVTILLLAPADPTALRQGAVDPALLAVSLPTTILLTLGLCWWVSRTAGVGLLEPIRGRGGEPARTAPIGGVAVGQSRENRSRV